MAHPAHPPAKSKSLAVAFGLNLALVVGEVIGSALAHSDALLADAGHNLADVAAIGLAIVALRFSLRRPTLLRSYGYHRATILASLANVSVLVTVSVLVAVESAWRIAHVSTVRPATVVVFASLAAVLNAACALIVARPDQDANLRAVLAHLGADALASLGVVLAGVVELLEHGWYVLDPVVSALIALLIGYEAVRLGRSSVDVLLESFPSDLDPAAVAGVIAGVPGVEGVHHLHCWSLSGDDRMLSAHVLLEGHPSLEEAQIVGDSVKLALGSRFSVGHATLELECEPCAEGGEIICTVETHPAAH